MNLFMQGDFTLASGMKSRWKIECDALTEKDWEGVAAIANEMLPIFHLVKGVPRGGIPFANALQKYARPEGIIPPPILIICEDVVTTGSSMERVAEQVRTDPNYSDVVIFGVCLFARGKAPLWVRPIFQIVQQPIQRYQG